MASLVRLAAASLALCRAQQPLAPIPSLAVSCPATPEGHFECGRQVGAFFKDLITADVGSDDLDAMYRRVQGTKRGQEIFASMVAAHSSRYPDYMQEINGTAHGASVPMDRLLVSNFAQELGIAGLGRRLRGASGRDATRRWDGDHCSDVFLPTAWAHNEDGSQATAGRMFFVKMRTYDARGDVVEAFTGLTYPGLLFNTAVGWNRHGVAFSANTLYIMPDAPVTDGIAANFVLRDMARATSIENAISRAALKNLGAGQNLNLGSFQERRIVTLETAPGGKSDAMPVSHDRSPYFHANELLRLKDVAQDEGNAHLTSARHRHQAFLRTPPPADVAGLLSFLGDTSDAQFPVFRRNDRTNEWTLFTAVFDLAEGTVSFYRANPRLGSAALLLQEQAAQPAVGTPAPAPAPPADQMAV